MMADSAPLIGNRLREIRKSLSISLENASRLTGVSKPMLGQIERGQSTPTVTTLWKIATGLKVPLSSFLQERQSDYAVVDIHSEEPVSEDGGKMRVYPVFPYDPVQSMEMFFIEFDPGCRHDSERHADGVEEYVMVVSGKLQLTVGGEEVELAEGEAIHFRADVDHEYNNPFERGCTAYNIIFYPSL